MTLGEYLNLITTEHRDRAKFVATVAAVVQPQVDEQTALAAFAEAFDIDTAAGVQLDIVGLWIGRARRVAVPITGVFFSWDDTPQTGWDSGVWRGPFDPEAGIVILPDDTYRVLLKAKIAANSWDGSIPGAYAIWDEAFGDGSALLIQDHQDMSMDIGIVGPPLSAVTRALLIGGYLPLKPAGVRIRSYSIGANSGPLFAWNVSNDLLAGWGTGSWAIELSPN